MIPVIQHRAFFRTDDAFFVDHERATFRHAVVSEEIFVQRAIGGPAEAVYCSLVTGKGQIVAMAGGQDGVLWIWQLDNGQVLQQLK